MAWTAPYTWSVGEQATAAKFNQHIRDNLAYLKGQAGNVELEDDLRLPNARILYWRNGGNTADLRVFDVEAANHLNIARDDSIDLVQVFGSVVFYDDAASPSTVAEVAASTGLTSLGMRAHRHPYASNRHIEGGAATGCGTGASVTFTDAFSATPSVTTSTTGSMDFHTAQSVATTGFTLKTTNTGGGGGSDTGYWHAEGTD